MIRLAAKTSKTLVALSFSYIEGQSMNESSIQTQTEKMAKLTITLDIGPSDLLPLLIALLRDESGRTPASPFSREFRGFRVSGPFDLEDLLETLGRETREGEPEGEEPFKGFNRVAEEIQELRRRARPARPTGAEGDDTPPASPEGPQGFEGEPEGDDGIPAPDDR